MDPPSFIARAEAQRWIGIAEKLLKSHDIVGSKTFAIRARESDSRLEAADQILAIADTLLAAEKRIVGNNGSQQPDFYAILQLAQFVQDTDHIAEQYRRLAVLLNPHQNRFPYSDQAFQLVNDAWAVLSNPMRKSTYDSELDFQPQQNNPLGFNLEQHQQQQHQHNFFSINHMGSDDDQELPKPQQTFETMAQRNHQQQQMQQHNFLSQNPVRSVPVREQEQMFQHHEQEQQGQPQAQPFQVTSPNQQQTRPPPQPPQPNPPMQPPPPPPPAAPPLSQPQQKRQQSFQPQPQSQSQSQQSQQKQQEEESPEQKTGHVQVPSQVNNSNDAREEEREAEAETDATAENVDDSPTFWTTCPYCFYMYEYPRVYAECTLRCDHCKRAFQAVRIPSPPPIIEGQKAQFYCWGSLPFGVSMSLLQKNNDTSRNSNWTPFSHLYDVASNVQDHLNVSAAPKKNFFVNKSSGPRIYIDDVTDDIFTGISESEPSDVSDLEWNGTREKKMKRMKKSLKSGSKKDTHVLAVRVRTARNGRDKNTPHDIPTVPVAESSKEDLGSSTRRQSGRVAKELGKLDLNVEFNNNEGEEAAPRMTDGNSGNGREEEDNIEGNGFFEGLDEFLSSLPILSVVNEEKVKAA